MINPDDILTTLYRKLDGDATLQDADHLDGADKIALGSRRKEGHVNPTLTIVPVTHIQDKYNKSEQYTIRINAFADNPAVGVIDTQRLGRIVSRCATLLDDTTLTDPSGVRIFENFVEGNNGPFYDSSSPDESYISLLLRVVAIKTA